MKHELARLDSVCEFVLRVVGKHREIARVLAVLYALVYVTARLCACNPVYQCGGIKAIGRVHSGVFNAYNAHIIGGVIVKHQLKLHARLVAHTLCERCVKCLCFLIHNRHAQSVEAIRGNLIYKRLMCFALHVTVCAARKRSSGGNVQRCRCQEFNELVRHKLRRRTYSLNVNLAVVKQSCDIKLCIIVNVFSDNDFNVITANTRIKCLCKSVFRLLPARSELICVQLLCVQK